MTSAAQPLVRVVDLVKSFGDGEAATHVLKGVNMTLEKGEFSALLGPSGSGKSTLLTILGTLMRPSSGSLMMEGLDLAALDERAVIAFRSQHIGFVFQFHHLLPDFTAMENVVFPAAAREGALTPALMERARELLSQVGLSHRIDYLSTQLSGGQKQRVAIARALMNAPALILADEPTGNLDRESSEQVLDLLQAINRDQGTTFLISTHDAHVAARCGRRFHVLDGHVTAS